MPRDFLFYIILRRIVLGQKICYTRYLKCTILYNLGPIIYNSYIFSDNLAIFSDIPRFFYRISLSIVPIL